MNWPNPKLCITGLVVTLCSGFPVYHMVVINPAEDVFKVRLLAFDDPALGIFHS